MGNAGKVENDRLGRVKAEAEGARLEATVDRAEIGIGEENVVDCQG